MLKDWDTIESWEIFKSKMQEGMNKFISKQLAGYVTNKPLWMSYRALKDKNKKYFFWKNVYKSSIKVTISIYALARTVSRIVTFQIFLP